MTIHAPTIRNHRPEHRSRLLGLGLVLATVVAALVGCSGLPTTGSSSASCSLAVRFAGHAYRDAGPAEGFSVTGKLGTGTSPPCDDSNPGEGNTLPEDQRGVTVFRVGGLSPDDGIAIRSGDGPAGYRLLGRTGSDGWDLTPNFEDFLATHRPGTGSTDQMAPPTTIP